MHRAMTGPLAAALLATMVWLPAQAAEGVRTRQQELMANCNKLAAEEQLRGDDRTQFMSRCLNGQEAVPAEPMKVSPQERMTNCNREAGARSLKGAGRKQFMSACLKK